MKILIDIPDGKVNFGLELLHSGLYYYIKNLTQPH